MWPLTHQINKCIRMLGAGSISYSSLWACVVWVQILSWFDSLSCLWRYLTETGYTLHTRWKQQFPSNYSLWDQIVVVFSPRLRLTASVSLSSHWHYLEDVGLMIRLKHWFEAFLCFSFLFWFVCFLLLLEKNTSSANSEYLLLKMHNLYMWKNRQKAESIFA